MDIFKNVISSELQDKYRSIICSLDGMENNKKKRFVKKILYRSFMNPEETGLTKQNVLYDKSLIATHYILLNSDYYKVNARKLNILSNFNLKLEIA